MKKETRGSTLIVVLLLSSVIAAAGLSLSIVARQERVLSVLHARELRLRRAALDAVRFTVTWFANPELGPTPAQVRRMRLPLNPLDPDGPPLLPLGQYKERIDLNRDGEDDLFQPPYRDSAADRFLGHPDHPDLTILDQPFLLQMNRDLFGDDEPAAVERRRIERIDLYAPPIRLLNGEWVRHGIATVAAVVLLERREGDDRYRVVGRRVARGVIQQTPFARLAGPMVESCASLVSRGGWSPRWGRVRVGADLSVEDLPDSIPTSFPVDENGALWSGDAAWIAAFNAAVDQGQPVPDPWMRIAAGGEVVDAPTADAQPWPHLPPTVTAPAPWNCCGHSHISQSSDQPICSAVDYELWKSLSQSGLRGTAYYEWVEADRYRDSEGVVRGMQQILEQDAGMPMLRFFDTANGSPPADVDGDGTIDNLAPAASLSAGIGLRGLLLTHARNLTLQDLDDSLTVALKTPREPASRDGSAWIDLQMLFDQRFYPGGPPERSEIEVALNARAAMEGVVIQAGDLALLGRQTLVGRIRAQNIAMDVESGYSRIYPIPELKDRGVVPGWRLPLFVIGEIAIDGG